MKEQFELLISFINFWSISIMSLILFVIGWLSKFNGDIFFMFYFFVAGSLILVCSLFPYMRIKKLQTKIKEKYFLLKFIRMKNKRRNKK